MVSKRKVTIRTIESTYIINYIKPKKKDECERFDRSEYSLREVIDWVDTQPSLSLFRRDLLINDKIKQINISGYLLEPKLGDLLREMLPDIELIHQYKVKVGRRNLRVDYGFVIDGITFFVEFDGDTHYCKATTQKRDVELKNYCIENKIILIRIPYFVQVDNYTKLKYFNHEKLTPYIDSVEIFTDFPHGFISKSCVLPADFNMIGWELFMEEYWSFIRGEFDMWSIMQGIWHSLDNRCRSQEDANYIFGRINTHHMTPEMMFEHYPS